MRIKLFLPVLLIAASFITGCEKVVDTNIADAQARYVIEGFISNTGRCRVLISNTASFSSSNEMQGISGAIVQIADSIGTPIRLKERDKGIYDSEVLYKALPGRTYHLHVTIGDEVFTATCKMPLPVKYEGVTVTQQAVAGKSQYVATAIYQDPEATGNYYRFIQFNNERQQTDIFVTSDNIANGRQVSYSLLNPTTLETKNSNSIKAGDTIRVEMQCIDAAVYKYWYSLNASASGSGIISAPANPVTNITGGALGYFSAYSSQSKRTIVK